jgi:predicted ester cyclase
MGIAPTDRRVEMSAIDVFRFVDGKIVGHWGHADDLTAALRSPEQP